MATFASTVGADMASRPKNKAIYLSNYCVGNGTDESANLQSAITKATQTKSLLICDVPGVIGLSSTVTMGNLNANSTRENIFFITGTLRISAKATITNLLEMRGTFDAGSLTLEMDGANRAYVGLYSYNIGRSRFGSVMGRNFLASSWVIDPTMKDGVNNNNCFSVRDVQATGCGSKHTSVATVDTAWAGGMTSPAANPAYSTWTLSTPLPAHMRCYSWITQVAVMADGRIQTVVDVSADGTTIKIAHEAREVGYSETITLRTAAVQWPYNPDAGAWHVGSIDISSCANAVALIVGGYGGGISSLVMQNCAIGLAVPIRASGIDIGYLYEEAIPTWLYVCHSKGKETGSGISIGAGQKVHGTIQIADRGIFNNAYMTMTGRDTVPPNWIIVGHDGDAPIVSEAATTPTTGSSSSALTPLVPPKTNTGTETVTPGYVHAFTSTAPSFGMRINNDVRGSVGMVHFSAPTTGSGILINVSLLRSNGDTIAPAAVGQKVLGNQMFVFYQIGGVWYFAPTGAPTVAPTTTA